MSHGRERKGDGGETAAGAHDRAAPTPGKRTLIQRKPSGAPAKPKPKPVEEKGHQEESWARPSTTLATEPAHVGTIYFRTKEYTLDSQDESVLKTLATAYAPYAKRNIGVHGGELGLKGSVVGYADPRPSVEPNNEELSDKRAFWTATRLARSLSAESHLEQGYFDLAHRGEGVAPSPDDDDAPVAEGNTLAPLRRADIYLAGKATPPTEPAPAPKKDDAVKPPKLHDWPKDSWLKHRPAFERGDKETIRNISAWLIGVLATQGNNIDDILFWTGNGPAASFASKTGSKYLPIGVKKPPWWDARGDGIGASMGRSAARNELVGKALLFLRDYEETMKFAEAHVQAPTGSYVLFLAEIKKDAPDEAKLAEWKNNLEYLRFMLDETQNLGEQVFKLADK